MLGLTAGLCWLTAPGEQLIDLVFTGLLAFKKRLSLNPLQSFICRISGKMTNKVRIVRLWGEAWSNLSPFGAWYGIALLELDDLGSFQIQTPLLTSYRCLGNISLFVKLSVNAGYHEVPPPCWTECLPVPLRSLSTCRLRISEKCQVSLQLRLLTRCRDVLGWISRLSASVLT